MNPKSMHMNHSRTFKLLFVAAVTFAFSAGAYAQATRTWVSGVGDDVNPCSRTAPCKTFAGAISKTAEGGEISVLDPGGFGTLTINKAMTIDGGTGGGWASVLNTAGLAGFNVNVTTGTHVNDAVVILRNITINGAVQAPSGNGGNGISFIKAARLIVERCYIEDQSTTGITQASLATTGSLEVEDCFFDNVGTGVNARTTSGFATTQIDNCRFNGSTDGVNATSNAFVTIRNCVFAGGAGSVNGAVRAAVGATVNVSTSLFANNGIGVNIAGGVMRISNNDFFQNTTAIANGTAESANNNKFRGNGSDGLVSNVIVVK
jgi:hypothetical protein